MRYSELDANVVTIEGAPNGSCDVFMKDATGLAMVCAGTTVPTGAGYKKGCIFIKTDAAAGAAAVYTNQGSSTSASFNNSGTIADTAEGLGTVRQARTVFDFSDQPTAGTFNTNITLPDNARVIRAYYEVTTTFADDNADATTIAIGINTNDVAGIVAAVAISDGGNPWDAGLHECIQDGTMANASEKTTAARTIDVVVAGADTLTAGSMVIVLEYIVTA